MEEKQKIFYFCQNTNPSDNWTEGWIGCASFLRCCTSCRWCWYCRGSRGRERDTIRRGRYNALPFVSSEEWWHNLSELLPLCDQNLPTWDRALSSFERDEEINFRTSISLVFVAGEGPARSDRMLPHDPS